MIDQHSRFPEVEVYTSTTAGAITPKLDKVFPTHGIPNAVTTDNGTPYDSAEFANYIKQNGIKHHQMTPLWPQGNAETDSIIKTLMKAIRTALAKGRNWRCELHKFLLNHRSTPLTTTGVEPAELLGGRLSHLEHDINSREVRNKALAKDAEAKCRMKLYADKRSTVIHKWCVLEQLTLFRQNATKKLPEQ